MGIATLSKNPYQLTGNSVIDATTNGYKWYFPAGASKVLNWSVSSSEWNHPSLQTAAVQNNFSQAFANIAEFINVKFNFLGYVTGSGGKLGYENARLQGSDMNITFAYEGRTTAGALLSDRKFTTTSETAFCYFPDADNDSLLYFGAPGDTWLNYNNPFIRSLNFNVGTNGFQLLSHEILHGLGLKHPHDSGGTGRPTYAELGISFADRQWVSTMSYDLTKNGGDSAYQGSQPIGPMIYDAIALQYLYGESSLNSGNTTYDLTRYIGNYYNCQWDSSGTDTLNGANLTFGIVVDMGYAKETNGFAVHNVGFVTTWLDNLNLSTNGTNPEKWTWLWGEYENLLGTRYIDSLSGNDLDNDINGGDGDDYMEGREGNDRFDWDSSKRSGNDTMYGGMGDDVFVLNSTGDTVIEYANEGKDSIWVDFSYSISSIANVENLFGYGINSLSLIGNNAANSFIGGKGNDTLNGGAGIDTVVYAGNRSNYTLTKNASSFTISSSAEGTDTLTNVENLTFSNVTLPTSIDLFLATKGTAVAARGANDVASAIATQMSVVYLGRPADKTLLLDLKTALDNGQPLEAVLSLISAKSIQDGAFSANDSSKDIVINTFNNIMGFLPSAFEQTAWANYIDNGTLTKANAPWIIFQSYLGANNVPDVYKLPTQARFVAAQTFSDYAFLDTNQAGLASLNSIYANAARKWLAPVDSVSHAAAKMQTMLADIESVTLTGVAPVDSFIG